MKEAKRKVYYLIQNACWECGVYSDTSEQIADIVVIHLQQEINKAVKEERERVLNILDIRASSIGNMLLEHDDERLDAKGELIMELRKEILTKMKEK